MNQEDQEEGEGEEADEDDTEIQEMKAKFNQILANFDNDASGDRDGLRQLLLNGNGSQQQS